MTPVFDRFDPRLRIEVNWAALPFDVLATVVAEARAFVAQIDQLKAAKRGAASDHPQRLKRKRVKTSWA